MAKRIKRFVVTMAYEDNNTDKPYIKQWWAESHLKTAIDNHLPQHNQAISNVEVKLESVENLTSVLENLIDPITRE